MSDHDNGGSSPDDTNSLPVLSDPEPAPAATAKAASKPLDAKAERAARLAAALRTNLRRRKTTSATAKRPEPKDHN